jgi:hypothetical protein
VADQLVHGLASSIDAASFLTVKELATLMSFVRLIVGSLTDSTMIPSRLSTGTRTSVGARAQW